MRRIIQSFPMKLGKIFDDAEYSLKSSSGAFISHRRTKIEALCPEGAG
jgi:hypothetical protein